MFVEHLNLSEPLGYKAYAERLRGEVMPGQFAGMFSQSGYQRGCAGLRENSFFEAVNRHMPPSAYGHPLMTPLIIISKNVRDIHIC
jgi:hypothetical protein